MLRISLPMVGTTGNTSARGAPARCIGTGGPGTLETFSGKTRVTECATCGYVRTNARGGGRLGAR